MWHQASCFWISPFIKCMKPHYKCSMYSSSILGLQSKQQQLSSWPSCCNFSVSARTSSTKACRIGCASGFWGDTPTAVSQLVSRGRLDYLILDYLSEITMSLLTAAKAKNPQLGYAPDFVVHAVGPHLKQIKQQGIKVITNAGGINPPACAAALQAAAAKAGVELKVGVVTGDDLMPRLPSLLGVPDLATGAPLPKGVHSINAYTGAGGILRALELGADIVVTGRCADSSLALAPTAFHHGWRFCSMDEAAGASLAGHLLECGAQVTGGNHTDWRKVQGWHNMGFPIASISADGSCVLSKPPSTGGLLSRGTVCEQMLYEVGDPRAYILPDVVLDLSAVRVGDAMEGENGEVGVAVQGAKGLMPTSTYKVGATVLSGYKATAVCCIGGPEAAQKCAITAEATLERVNGLLREAGVPPITRHHVQVLGSDQGNTSGTSSAVLWLSVSHPSRGAVDVFGRELAAAGTGGVPGLMGLVGGRPKTTPVLALHSSLISKKDVPLTVTVGSHSEVYCETGLGCVDYSTYQLPDQPTSALTDTPSGTHCYRLEQLALTRSGDKSDSCNIGVVARHPDLLPFIKKRLTSEAVAQHMRSVFQEGDSTENCVSRYEVPGIAGLNFVLHRSLGGGGVASLRPDPQGKAYGQRLLDLILNDMPCVDHLINE